MFISLEQAWNITLTASFSVYSEYYLLVKYIVLLPLVSGWVSEWVHLCGMFVYIYMCSFMRCVSMRWNWSSMSLSVCMNASILYMCLLACLHMQLHVQYVSMHLHIESNIGMCNYGCVSGMHVTLHYCLSVYEYITLCVSVSGCLCIRVCFCAC